MTTVEERTDARRNRERIIGAAVEAITDSGSGVPLSEVARRAGLGIATVHRHFPSRDLLLETVLARLLDEATERAPEGAPDVALFTFLDSFLEATALRGPLCGAVAADTGWPHTVLAGAVRRFELALAARLRRAQAAGAVRRDVGAAEVASLLLGCATMIGRSGAAGQRMARIALDALRVTEPEFRDSCAVCGAALAQAGTGRPARYCGPTCRQRAHRVRSAATLG